MSFFGSEKKRIPYDKHIAQITGSMSSAVLFQQMLFNYGRKQGKPFYKFFMPCGHPLYRPYDSWTEELGIGETAFTNALKRIGTRAKTKDEIREFLKKKSKEFCVIYYTDHNNLTWFYLNEVAIEKVASQAEELMKKEYAAKDDTNEAILDPLSEDLIPDRPDQETELRITKSIANSNSTTPHKFYGNETREVKEKKRKAPLKQRNTQSKLWANARTLPIDFKIEGVIMDDALNSGYEELDITDEGKKFISYYGSGKGSTKRHYNWKEYFIDFWLNKNYRDGNIKRFGKFYQTSKNVSRSDSIREILDPDMFAEFTGQ